jgi:hypothetical protein
MKYEVVHTAQTHIWALVSYRLCVNHTTDGTTHPRLLSTIKTIHIIRFTGAETNVCDEELQFLSLATTYAIRISLVHIYGRVTAELI